MPDQSPSNRKVSRTNSGEVPSSRKSLFSEAQKQHEQNEPLNSSENQLRNEDLLLAHSNIDDLLGNKEAMVKVIIVRPNGKCACSHTSRQAVKESCEEHFLEKLESSGKWCFWPRCSSTGRIACREQSRQNSKNTTIQILF